MKGAVYVLLHLCFLYGLLLYQGESYFLLFLLSFKCQLPQSPTKIHEIWYRSQKLMVNKVITLCFVCFYWESC